MLCIITINYNKHAFLSQEYNGKIGSYECECNDDEYQPRPPSPRPDSCMLTFVVNHKKMFSRVLDEKCFEYILDPPLIDIPNTLDEVIKMLSDKNHSEHPGLRGALKSLRHKRSGKNAYILLLGATGAGKSSAVSI